MKTGLNTINTYVINDFLGETVPLVVGTGAVSVSVAFFLPASARNFDVMVTNAGTKTAFIAFGDSTKGTVTAQAPGTNGTTNATPVLPGAIYNFQKNSDAVQANTCAAICNSGENTTLYFTSVQGS